MLTITVEFLHGVVRIGSADDLALSGEKDFGEWPPSPARLLSAFVAADGTGERTHVTTGDELQLIESPPEQILADDRRDVVLSHHQLRYVPVDATDKSTAQDYPARKATHVRPSPRLSPLHPEVTYVWPSVDADKSQMEALCLRAARIGYIGSSDSPARITVGDKPPDATARWILDSKGTAALPAPQSGTIDVLDSAFAAWSAGVPTRRSALAIPQTRYRQPFEPTTDESDAPTTLWLRFDGSLAGRHAILIAETLRAAVLSNLPDDAPAVVHGHGDNTKGRQQVCWIPLPNVGGPHADGRIRGAAVWIPARTEPAVVQQVRAACLGIQTLTRPGAFSVAVAPYTGEPRPWSTNPDRWSLPSRQFTTALPAVHERWLKGPPDLQEIQRWCEHSAIPAPESARVSHVPFMPSAISLRPHEAHRPGHEARPYSHLLLSFATPVSGPLLIGRSRQFGLGLLAPTTDRRFV